LNIPKTNAFNQNLNAKISTTENNLHSLDIKDEHNNEVVPAGRSQRIQNPSLKAYEILEGKAFGLVEELDWVEVHVLLANMEEAKGLEPSSLKEAMQRAD